MERKSIQMRVIIPCWLINENLVELTRNAINSLETEELIIIDNGSPVAGGLLRESASIYVRNKENLGYAKAVNQGLKLCDKGEILAVSNNDVRVSEGWEQVAKEIMKDEKIASLHFKMIPYDEPFKLGDKIWISGKERWCTNSFFVMRNSGLFDENFLNSYDDWDLHYRMYQKGFKTAYTNKVAYQHMDSFTQQFIPERKDIDVKNREYFIKKHGDEPEKLWKEMFPEQMSQDYRGGFE